MVTGAVAGLAVCLLGAAVRAPYFRAIIGLGYPLAPRSGEDLARLFLFYLVTYPIFYLLPYSFPPESSASHVLTVLVTVLALVLVFGDYAVIFERLDPWRALKRSASLLRKGLGVVIGLYLLAWLALGALHTLYDGVYERGTGVFPLFPLSQIILESLIVLVIDVFLIFLYDHLRRL